MEKEKLEEARMVDVHAHLDEIEDLSRSLQEAKVAGVMGVVAVEMDNRIKRFLRSPRRTMGMSTQPWVTTPGK